MKYGLPYKGSKNKLAERIVRLLPRCTNLVDLFCGGCAVSHAALLMGKYEHIYINDINWMCPTLFLDALQGKYENDTRWISREDFFRLKDTDPYVALVWSFGNNLRDYIYSREIEPLKKAIHYAIFFSDYSLAKALGHDLSFIAPIQGTQQRYIAVKRYFELYGHFQMQNIERGGQMQVEHITRRQRLQITPPRRNGSPTATSRNCDCQATSNGRDWEPWPCHNHELHSKKNPKAALGGRTPRANQLPYTDCNIKNDCTACPEQCSGGGVICPSPRRTLIMPRWRYQRIA